MKILFINSVCGIRSTGKIVAQLAKEYINNGHECCIAYGRENVPEELKSISKRIGSDLTVKVNAVKARLLDNEGMNSKRATKKFLKWASTYNPDVLWLHNLHGYYLNIELLFKWIKNNPQIQVKWTLHDCWAFTGHCSYFSFVKCDLWQVKCENCPQFKKYPKSLFLDASKKNFERKKRAFCGVNNMTLITPSKWLANLVKKSFLKEYPIEVSYNVVDTTVFCPTKSDFRIRYNLDDRKIVLGVASIWDDRKGLDDLLELSTLLSDDYMVVLVGTIFKKITTYSSSIICIPQTNSAKELAEIYTAADVFVNPSKEETFGLTTLEAISCGTPAIVYKNTACEEVVNLFGGIAVEQSVCAIKLAIEQLMLGGGNFENFIFRNDL